MKTMILYCVECSNLEEHNLIPSKRNNIKNYTIFEAECSKCKTKSKIIEYDKMSK